MDTALESIKQLAAQAGEDTRRKLKDSLNKLALSLESPSDTIHRYGHMVSELILGRLVIKILIRIYRISRQLQFGSASISASSNSCLGLTDRCHPMR